MLVSQDEETVDSNLLSWEVSSVTPTEIQLKLQFVDPLEVSQGGQPEFLLVQAQLGEFKDEFGRQLPEGIIKKREIPPQFRS